MGGRNLVEGHDRQPAEFPLANVSGVGGERHDAIIGVRGEVMVRELSDFRRAKDHHRFHGFFLTRIVNS